MFEKTLFLARQMYYDVFCSKIGLRSPIMAVGKEREGIFHSPSSPTVIAVVIVCIFKCVIDVESLTQNICLARQRIYYKSN